MPFDLTVPAVLVQVGYLVIGWQAGVAFTRDSLRAVGRTLPAALALIVVLTVATAGLGALLARFAGLTPLEGYLATSPGGVYAVLATAVETGSNVTFIIAAQVVRILLMLFAAPFVAKAIVRVSDRLPAATGARRYMIGCAAMPLALKFASTKVRKLGLKSRAGRNVRSLGQLA